MNSFELFEIGSDVEVSDSLYAYSLYPRWAELHGLSRYKAICHPDTGVKYKVVARGFHDHGWNQDVVYGIEDASGVQFIINGKGLKKLPKTLTVYLNLYDGAGAVHHSREIATSWAVAAGGAICVAFPLTFNIETGEQVLDSTK